jgi:cardiolipin synthase
VSSDEPATFSWLRTGTEAFASMLQDIAAAKSSVRLESYIFAPGEPGDDFRTALTAAGRRGVRVQVLVDSFGSQSLSSGYWSSLAAAGGEARWFNPLSLERFGFRDHRKLLVCDDGVATVGGFNIAPEYVGDGISRGWRDLGLRLTGPMVAPLAAAFDELFGKAEFRHRLFMRVRRHRDCRRYEGPGGELLLSGPGRGRSPIETALCRDFKQARTIQIAMAYFLPTGRIRRALTRAARRGATVQLLLGAKSDVTLARLATQAFYRRLLRTGMEIHEYQPQILHMKLVIADEVVYVGSANLDLRSMHINYELMLRLREPVLAAEARLLFRDDLDRARRVDRARWRGARSFWERLKHRWACFILCRVDPYIARRQLRMLESAGQETERA